MIASKVLELVKKLGSQLKEIYFDEMDWITIFAFLKAFRDTCYSIGIQERVITSLVSKFIEKLE